MSAKKSRNKSHQTLTGVPLSGVAPESVTLKPVEVVRLGIVGVGGMGNIHLTNLLKLEGVEIVAIAEVDEQNIDRAKKKIADAGFAEPKMYSRNKNDYVRMVETEELDVVYAATPWETHVPICLAAMENGKHVFSEVPVACTVEDCWKLVEMVEKTGLHCGMMENCCYDRFELLILNMVKKGLFGDVVHGECGYLHDLRGGKFHDRGEGIWRRNHSLERNGDLYPTHGLGPIAQCMDINRGNRFDHLVSMSSASKGLDAYAVEHFGPDSPQAQVKHKLGDIVVTLIRTINGQTITMTHDTSLPRPYSRNILIQGIKGIARKYPSETIALEVPKKRKGGGEEKEAPKKNQGGADEIEVPEKGHHSGWKTSEEYYKEYEHPISKELEKKGEGVGHGGLDYIQEYRLINAFHKGIQPDMDVYDAVAWSVVGPLSEASIAGGSTPVEIPDFTRGRWKKPRELQVMKPETY